MTLYKVLLGHVKHSLFITCPSTADMLSVEQYAAD